MSNEDLEKVREAIKNSQDLTDIPDEMKKRDVGMPKSKGGYVSMSSVEEACEKLQYHANKSRTLQTVHGDENLEITLRGHFTCFTRQRGIRPLVKDLYQRNAEES